MSDGLIPRLNAALTGRYAIERELGEGGMATVYVAHDVRHDRRVAIKVLRPELAAVIGGERFLAEIKTTANLQHPHVLPLFDSGEADGFLFYVMPLLEGASLRDRLAKEKQLPVDEAVRIARAVASALDYAHRSNVIHRDIKPANILLHDGQPVVADFGIALAVSAAGGGRLTETGLSVGTPAYMSPEQATADRDPGPTSDIYSLGCVLYEMLTGEPPFTGSSAQAILGKIITGTPTLLTEHRPSIPAHVEAVVLKALEKLPADRYRSAEAFSAALEDRTAAHPRQTITTAAAVGARGSWISQGASRAAVGVMALLAAWAGFATLRPAEGPAPRPVTRTVIQAHIEGPFALSRDGRWLANDSAGAIFLRRLDQETSRRLELPGAPTPHAFSPDGRFLLAATNDQLLRIPTDGGAPLTVVSTEGIVGADWSDDDRIVYVAFDGMHVVPATGGTSERVLEEGGTFTVWGPRFVPGGRFVLFVRGTLGGNNGTVQVLDLETGEDRLLLEEGLSPQFAATGHLVFARPDQSVFAVPFDPRRAQVTGTPQQVADSVVVFPIVPWALFAISDAGTAVFRRGRPMEDDQAQRRYVLLGEDGEAEMIQVPAGNVQGGDLSPDERFLAYQRDVSIYIYDRITGLNRLLTPEGVVGGTPVWSRDGSQVAYFTLGSRGGATYVLPADGAATGRDIAGGAGPDGVMYFPGSWGGDDASFLAGVQAMGAQSGDLVTVRLGADTTVTPYLQADWDEGAPAVSPDGRWAAYRSNESGDRRVYVRAYPEPGRAFVVSPEGQDVTVGPLWAPDGGALYWRNSGDSVLASVVATEPDFTSGPASLVLVTDDAGPQDVTRDGRLLMLRAVETDSTGADDEAGLRRTVLVVNWFEELKRILGAGS